MAFKKGIHNFTVAEAQNLALGQNGAVIIEGGHGAEEISGPFVAITALEATVVDTSECTTNLSGTVPATFAIPVGTTIYGKFDSIELDSGSVIAYYI